MLRMARSAQPTAAADSPAAALDPQAVDRLDLSLLANSSLGEV